MRRAIAAAVCARSAPRLLAMVALVLGSFVLSGCLVDTDGADEQVYELNEVSGVDFDRIPRASEAATSEGPRRPDPATSAVDDTPAADFSPSSDQTTEAVQSSDLTQDAPDGPGPDGTGTDQAPLSEADESVPTGTTTASNDPAAADPSSDADSAASDEPAPVIEPEPAATDGEASDGKTDPELAASDPEPTAVPVPTATPLAEVPAATSNPTAIPAPTAAPQVSQVAAAAAGPVATDDLSVSGSAITDANGQTPELSQSGALACSIVELSLDELDRGDLANFGADMNTAAGFAASAPETGLSSLASSLPTAASSANPIDVVGAFLTACATYGYEI